MPGVEGACAGVRSSSRPMSVTYWCLVFPVFWVQGSFPCPMLASACSPLGSSLLLPHSGPGAGALVRCAYRTLPYSPSGSLWQVLVFPGHVFRPRFAHCCSVDVVTAGAAAPFSHVLVATDRQRVLPLVSIVPFGPVAGPRVSMNHCLPSFGLPLRCPRMCALPLFSCDIAFVALWPHWPSGLLGVKPWCSPPLDSLHVNAGSSLVPTSAVNGASLGPVITCLHLVVN